MPPSVPGRIGSASPGRAAHTFGSSHPTDAGSRRYTLHGCSLSHRAAHRGYSRSPNNRAWPPDRRYLSGHRSVPYRRTAPGRHSPVYPDRRYPPLCRVYRHASCRNRSVQDGHRAAAGYFPASCHGRHNFSHADSAAHRIAAMPNPPLGSDPESLLWP